MTDSYKTIFLYLFAYFLSWPEKPTLTIFGLNVLEEETRTSKAEDYLGLNILFQFQDIFLLSNRPMFI